MAETINYRFRMRRAMAATWASLNDVLLEGEYGYEKDTKRKKIGDGVTAWNDLAYDNEEIVVPLSTVGGVAEMDCEIARFFTLDLSTNATLNIVNPPQVDCLILKVVPSAGAQLTLPSSVSMLDGSDFNTGAVPFALGLMTLDGGVTFDAVVGQP